MLRCGARARTAARPRWGLVWLVCNLLVSRCIDLRKKSTSAGETSGARGACGGGRRAGPEGRRRAGSSAGPATDPDRGLRRATARSVQRKSPTALVPDLVKPEMVRKLRIVPRSRI